MNFKFWEKKSEPSVDPLRKEVSLAIAKADKRQRLEREARHLTWMTEIQETLKSFPDRIVLADEWPHRSFVIDLLPQNDFGVLHVTSMLFIYDFTFTSLLRTEIEKLGLNTTLERQDGEYIMRVWF